MNNKVHVAAISKMMELLGETLTFAETMVNLKSWAIVIFLLNLHISCQTL